MNIQPFRKAAPYRPECQNDLETRNMNKNSKAKTGGAMGPGASPSGEAVATPPP